MREEIKFIKESFLINEIELPLLKERVGVR